MKKIFDTQLEAKVDARNRLNKAANDILPLLIANFTPLVGQKIMKASGLMEKYKGLVPTTFAPTGDPPEIRITCNPSNYSFSFNIRTESFYNHNNPKYGYGACVHYEEDIIYVGEFLNNAGLVLEKMCEHRPRKTDYNVEAVKAIRLEADRAEKLARDTEAACYPFGRYDQW